MHPFDLYPGGGRKDIGGPTDWTNCRHGYGRQLMERVKLRSCAYCGLDLTDTYEHWLLMSVDHVVPAAEARRLGIPSELAQGYINLVLACSGCNGFLNRHRVVADSPEEWTIDAFVALRDRVFAQRFRLVEQRRTAERAFYASQLAH